MKTIVIIALATLVVGLAAPLASAAPGDVMMADFLLLRVRCPAAGYSVEQRVDAIVARANDLLTLDGFDLSTIKVVKQGNDALLYANGKILVTVDPCTARANKTTPVKLANMWAARLREIYPQVVPKKPLLKEP